MLAKSKVLFAVFATFIVYLAFLFTGSAVTSIPASNFTVMPDTVYFNWTGTSINLTSNNQSVWLTVENTSNTSIGPVYFVTGFYVADSDAVYPGFSPEEYANCFTSVTSGMKFIVLNSSGSYMPSTNELNATNSTIRNLTALQYCPPGYYNGTFNVTQNAASDWLNITAHVVIPISAQNTFNETTSKAGFKGMLPSVANAYHSYYFNTSQAANITGVTLNLTWTDYSKDIDVFLFNSTGSLLGKGIERSGSEAIAYVALPAASDMWQIKVFGNASSQVNYTGWLYFTTLNATSSSNPNQKITSLDFGSLDPNATSSQINYTLNNTDTRAWDGVMESKELYHVDTWSSQTQSGYYALFVPHFAEKVKVKIEWTGATRWNLVLNDSSRSLIGNSSDRYYNANMSNVVQEEFVIYNGPFSTSNDGFWNITVANTTTPVSGSFNLTAYVWLPNSTIVSDYPASYTFAASGSKNVSVYVRVPEANIMNGTYEGFTEYYMPNEWKFRIPVHFSVKAGMMTLNNTFENLTATLHDNIGFNRLGANVLRLVLPVNNSGGYNISYSNTTSDYKLNNTESGKTDKYMTLAVDHWPSNPIATGQSDTLNISIAINTSLTGDEPGVYVGNITFNTGNGSANSSSYPFKVFTLMLRVNLTNVLTVNVTEVTSVVTAQQNASNVTANVTVKLANGSSISVNNVITPGDFSSAYLMEGNVTSYTITLENISQGDTAGWCPAGRQDCVIKAALVPGKAGGRYYFYSAVMFNTSVLNASGGTGKNLTGTGVSGGQVVINDTGIKLPLTGSFTGGEAFYEGTTSIYTVEITNYGPLAASSNMQIRFDKGSCTVSVARNTDSAYSNCSGRATYGPDNAIWNVSMVGYTPACKLSWTLTGSAIETSESPCYDASVRVITNHPNFGNITNIFINILGNETTAPGPQQGGQLVCTTNLTCANNQYCKNGTCTTLTCPSGSYVDNHVCKRYEGKLNITSYTDKINVLQGSSNSTSVTVKNIGGTTHTVKLEISSSGGLASSSNPSSYSLNAGNSGVFTVNFSASVDMTIGYYTVTVKAYASDNVSVYDTRTITVAVEPVEGTKVKINQTYDEIKELFASVATTFNQMPAASDANYTLANRTYYRLLNMLQDIENKIKLGNYLEAQGLLNEANSTLASFKLEISQIGAGGLVLALGGNIMTWVAILVVIVVIGGFLAYLLLPPKKGGYHPALGYIPKEKLSIANKLTHLFSKIKIKRPRIGGQKTLASFERPAAPVQPISAQPQAAARPPEKKTYMEGYHRLDQFSLSYDREKFKEKKK